MSQSNLAVFNDPFDSVLRTPNVDYQLSGRVSSHPGVITHIQALTHDTIEVTVKIESGSFVNPQAGQYGTLKVADLERPRAYSFAKAPSLENPHEVTFFIRLIEGGGLSNWFREKDRHGEEVTVSGAMGSFGLDRSDNTIVCIAGGSGMSAIKALVEQACHESVERDCYFFYGARTQADLYCQEEMAQIAKHWNPAYKFEFIQVLSEEPAGSDWTGPRSLVTEHMNEAYLQTGKIDGNKISAFFCGPPPMIDHGVDILTKAGVSHEQLFYDKFEDISSPAPVIDNAKCTVCDECLLVRPVNNCIVEASSFVIDKINNKVTNFSRLAPAKTSGIYYNSLFIDESACIRCYACVDACPHGAISPDNKAVPETIRII